MRNKIHMYDTSAHQQDVLSVEEKVQTSIDPGVMKLAEETNTIMEVLAILSD